MEQPVPQGKYLTAVRHADLIFTSGMTPRKAGILIYSGKPEPEFTAHPKIADYALVIITLIGEVVYFFNVNDLWPQPNLHITN